MALGFATALLLLVLGSVLEWRAREGELRETEGATLNLARAVIQHAEDTLDIADTALLAVQERLRTEDIGAEQAADRLQRFLQRRSTMLPRLRGLSIYDAEGRLLASSLPGARPGSTALERDWFRHHRDVADRAAFLGPPVQSRSDSRWMLTLSRRVDAADGSFAGAVVASVEASYFAHGFGTFELGQNGLVALLHQNGSLLARRPHDAALLGRDLSRAPLFGGALPQAASGSFRHAFTTDTIARVGGYRRGERYPLLAIVAVAEAEALADWRWEASWILAGVGVLAIGTALVGIALARLARRRQQAEAALAESEARFIRAMSAAEIGSWELDRDSGALHLSPHWKTLCGHAPEAFATPEEFLAAIDALDRDAVQQAFAAALDGSEPQLEIEFRMRDGHGQPWWLRLQGALLHDASGRPGRLSGVIMDITERKALEAQLEALALQDGLTGLANRRAFDHAYTAARQRANAEGEPLSVLLIDVDRFKFYNDHYGHQAGDACLRQVAQAVAGALRQSDQLAARYGGEEMAVLLPGLSPDAAAMVAERVRAAIQALALPHAASDPWQVVTASIGVATASDAAAMEGVLEAADQALYEAKRGGRNRVVTQRTVPTAAVLAA